MITHLDPIVQSVGRKSRPAGEWRSRLLIKNSNPDIKINISSSSKFVVSDDVLVPPKASSKNYTTYRFEETPNIDSLALSSQQSAEEMIVEQDFDSVQPEIQYVEVGLDDVPPVIDQVPDVVLPELEYDDVVFEDALNILYASEDEDNEIELIERPIQAVFDAECIRRHEDVKNALQDKVIIVGQPVRKAVKELPDEDFALLPTIGPPKTWKKLAKHALGRLFLQVLCSNSCKYFELGPKRFVKEMNSAFLSLLSDKPERLDQAVRADHRVLKLSPNGQIKYFEKEIFISKYFQPREIVERDLTEEDKRIVQTVLAQIHKDGDSHFAKSHCLKEACANVGMASYAEYQRVKTLFHKMGYEFRNKEKPKPALPAEVKDTRLRFCKWLEETNDEHPNFLGMLIHTDECSLQFRDETLGPNFGYWIRKGEENPWADNLNFSKKFPKRIMFAAAIGIDLKLSLRFFVREDNRGKLSSVSGTQKSYQELVLVPWFEELKEMGFVKEVENGEGVKHVLDGKIFVQDGATCHTATSSLKLIDESFGIHNVITGVLAKTGEGERFRRARLAEWPAHSPDLNPLDFCIWHKFKMDTKKELGRMNKLYFDSFEEAREILTRVWANISQDAINNACRGILRRAKETIARDGSNPERGYKANKGSFKVKNPRH
ncbi:Oidioi.mRNA.OKI2018_I69.chr2.g4190.t1.cds [Oikopleura dioica]|uniref:Oidioi.mRNA.OKI2018_I69.chr2.g4190.t1.cds n=1 Tax=Oikopleura dioica TaxID=34765 RepID=A0ABN7T362_OIKDI|nr:Oidioi.mRNA.OKI2018_I69.chr2.g4190.t1.cds [Oikopleura dioica]